MNWYVYMVRCRDNSLYCGITTDVNRREYEHNNTSAGAAYTRARRPVKIVWSETAATQSDALKREAEIKKLSKTQKGALVVDGPAEPERVIVVARFDTSTYDEPHIQTLWNTLQLVQSLQACPRLWKLNHDYMNAVCGFLQTPFDKLAVGTLWSIDVDLTTAHPCLIAMERNFPVLRL